MAKRDDTPEVTTSKRNKQVRFLTVQLVPQAKPNIPALPNTVVMLELPCRAPPIANTLADDATDPSRDFQGTGGCATVKGCGRYPAHWQARTSLAAGAHERATQAEAALCDGNAKNGAGSGQRLAFFLSR